MATQNTRCGEGVAKKHGRDVPPDKMEPRLQKTAPGIADDYFRRISHDLVYSDKVCCGEGVYEISRYFGLDEPICVT